MSPEQQSLLAYFQGLVVAEPALCALEMRLRWRELHPDMVVLTQLWAQQAGAAVQADAEARRIHDHVNAHMAMLGGRNEPVMSTAPQAQGQAQAALLLHTL